MYIYICFLLPDPMVDVTNHGGCHKPRVSRYGEHWGEGAARCFSLEADILDEELWAADQPLLLVSTS